VTESLYPDLAGMDLRRSVDDVVAEADLLVVTQHAIDYRMETARGRLPVIDLAGSTKPVRAKTRPVSRRVL
jgi:hypothetical protein